jgi:hypothetical protein
VHAKPLGDLTSNVRPLARFAMRVLAAALWLGLPTPAAAQLLPAKPINWLSPLPAPPPQVVQFWPRSETSNRFLKGRFLIGVSTSHALTPDQELGSRWNVSPFIRNTPRRNGWGPAFGLNWFKGDVTVSIDGQRVTVGEVKVRPVMVGVAYTWNRDRLFTNVSLTGGYAFTSARVTAAMPVNTAATIEIGNGWVVRPAVGMTYALTHRFVVAGSVGYVYTNPSITIDVQQLARAPSRYSGTFRGDYFNLSVGLAYSIF